VTAVFYIPLAYTAPACRDGSATACRRAGCDRNHVARWHTPASDLWFRSALARLPGLRCRPYSSRSASF
jgi:hypothetical protein